MIPDIMIPKLKNCILPFITIVLLSVHLFYIGRDDVFPNQTISRFEKRKLSDLEFPAVFKICISPGIDIGKSKMSVCTGSYQR